MSDYKATNKGKKFLLITFLKPEQRVEISCKLMGVPHDSISFYCRILITSKKYSREKQINSNHSYFYEHTLHILTSYSN